MRRRFAPAALVVCLLLAAQALWPGAATARTAGLATRVAGAMAIAGGASGAWIADADTGSRLYSYRSNLRRTPASVEKLFTAAAALDRMGAGARFETAALMNGQLAEDGELAGDLYIKGYGDPSFDRSALTRLAGGVLDAGVFDVSGRLFGDDSYFDPLRGPPSSAFSISQWVGPLSALTLHGGPTPSRSLMADPPRLAATRFRAALRSQGVVGLRAKARSGAAPLGAPKIASVWSPPLSSLIRHMNRISDNFYAEMLLKALGARFRAAGTSAAGAAVVARFQRTIGVSARVVDGSGLSRLDAVSPGGVGRLLVWATAQPWFETFRRSLPAAGREGTLRRRMRHTAAAGRCRAKTGTLIGVSALAGYCESAGGRTIAFALLMNAVSIARAHVAQDRIAAILASFRG